MAIDGFQLIQQLADRVARLEYQLLVNGKPQPAEYHTFSDIEDVLNRHKAVNKPQFGWYEVHLSPFRFITVKFRPNQFVVRLKSSNTQDEISMLTTDDASQVDIFIQAQKGNI